MTRFDDTVISPDIFIKALKETKISANMEFSKCLITGYQNVFGEVSFNKLIDILSPHLETPNFVGYNTAKLSPFTYIKPNTSKLINSMRASPMGKEDENEGKPIIEGTDENRGNEVHNNTDNTN